MITVNKKAIPGKLTALTSTTSKALVLKLKNHFARYIWLP